MMMRRLSCLVLLAGAWAAGGLAAEPQKPAAEPPPPQIVRLYAVAPDVLAVELNELQSIPGHIEPYEPQPGDEVREQQLYRNGVLVGHASPPGQDMWRYGDVIGRRLDAAWADAADSYLVSSPDDGTWTAEPPDAVYRKSHPREIAYAIQGDKRAMSPPVEHTLYLKLSRLMREGYSYRVHFVSGPWPDAVHCHRPDRVRSEAVHASHLGFRPDDPVKIAFLSCWMGSGGALSYPDETTFRVLEDPNGREAFVGQVRLERAADDTSLDSFRRNYNGTNVYILDFSPLAQPGTYRVCVEGVGYSSPFQVGADVWSRAFRTAARGIYHFRVGVEFGPPYSPWRNRRYFHPDDGDVVREGPVPFDVHIMRGLPRYEEDKLGPVLPGVWGGHRDAGGYQHQPRNMRAAWYLLDLLELFPDHFAGIRHDIPESDNSLPDALDEALFGLDLYRRLQTPEGGVRGGVFTVGNIVGGWSYQGPRIAYKPGCIASYNYAVGAGRAARCLLRWDADLATVYRESAFRAMEWAEAHWQEWPYPRNVWTMRRRAAAAAGMFRLTGEPRWNDAFHDSFESAKLDEDPRWEEREAAWIYARTDTPGVDAELRARCRDLVLENADFALAQVDATAFGWAKKAPDFPVIGCLSYPQYGPALVRAHVLSGEAKYLAGAVRTCQFGLGANPMNLCYTTRFGYRSPVHRFNLDVLALIAEPPDGWCLPGPMDMKYLGSDDYFRHEDQWVYRLVEQYAYPDLAGWPAMESYFDVFWLYPMHEGTVQGGVSCNAYTWGYLSARKTEAPGQRIR